MAEPARRARLLTLPVDRSPAGGRLDALGEEARRGRADLLMDYQELQLSELPALVECDGRPWERVQGVYIPRRLRFIDARIVEGLPLFAYLDDLPPDHCSRMLTGALPWRTSEGQNYYLFGVRVLEHPTLLLTAQNCVAELRPGPYQNVAFARDWSPPPASPGRIVPAPRRIHQRYGGDPIPVRLNERLQRRRLFVGGVDVQGQVRPDVHVVLNLGEVASRWAGNAPPSPADRWDNKGEGSEGMRVGEIAAEARWVIAHLQAGRRVLVHCSAGMNRSATVCCAVLILLEGLSAETALERVRAHHPWARPDAHHWLALRWLAHKSEGSERLGTE